MNSVYIERQFASRKFLLVALLFLFVNGANSIFNFKQSPSADSIRTDPRADKKEIYKNLWEESKKGRPFSHDSNDANELQGVEKVATSYESDKSSRTFGVARRRMQFALLPIMYKLGVISTLLVGLTILALKGLTIGVILLFFALGNVFSKQKRVQPPIYVHVHPYAHPIHTAFDSGPWDKISSDYEDFNSDVYEPSGQMRIPPTNPYRYSNKQYFSSAGR